MKSTKGKVFVDTNILIYLFSQTEPQKRKLAREHLEAIGSQGMLVWSTQVMQELFVVLTKKHGKNPLEVKNILHSFEGFELVTNNQETIFEAIDIQILNRLSFWDAMIVAAARAANCPVLLSEDLNHGQVIKGVEVLNPFLGGKERLGV